jgi:hypothetical protein
MHKSKLLVLIDAHKETEHLVLFKLGPIIYFKGNCLSHKQSFNYVPQLVIFCFSYKIRIN